MERNQPSYIFQQGKWLSRETSHFVFYYRAGSHTETIIDSICRQQENNYTEICESLHKRNPDYKITFFIFPSLKEKVAITHQAGYTHSIGDYNAVYYIDSDTLSNVLGKHEVTHLLMQKFYGLGPTVSSNG